MGGGKPEDSTEESGADHPDTESEADRREISCIQLYGAERRQGIARCVRGCSLKSVE